MTNYRTFNALQLNSGQSGSLDRAWGILRNSSGAGVLYLEARSGSQNIQTNPYVTMSIADIAAGQPFPCHVRSVTVTGGTVYILA